MGGWMSIFTLLFSKIINSDRYLIESELFPEITIFFNDK